MQNHKTQNNGEYCNVSIALLEESPSNPRKRFNGESLKELAGLQIARHSATTRRQGKTRRRKQVRGRGRSKTAPSGTIG